jgi:hypothetical protein
MSNIRRFLTFKEEKWRRGYKKERRNIVKNNRSSPIKKVTEILRIQFL